MLQPPHALVVRDANREFAMILDHSSLDAARALVAEHGQHRSELPTATALRD
jgi:hypothetical protein